MLPLKCLFHNGKGIFWALYNSIQIILRFCFFTQYSCGFCTFRTSYKGTTVEELPRVPKHLRPESYSQVCDYCLFECLHLFKKSCRLELLEIVN